MEGPREEVVENEEATRWRGSHTNGKADRRKEEPHGEKLPRQQHSRKTYRAVCLHPVLHATCVSLKVF